mmetsp:Transcript_16548/g.39629  ORF Transcript_16548/g.39629 Transcript_16548/m.39629 type:complete len:309 (+) Transcript_16548:362-1288(+)
MFPRRVPPQTILQHDESASAHVLPRAEHGPDRTPRHVRERAVPSVGRVHPRTDGPAFRGWGRRRARNHGRAISRADGIGLAVEFVAAEIPAAAISAVGSGDSSAYRLVGLYGFGNAAAVLSDQFQPSISDQESQRCECVDGGRVERLRMPLSQKLSRGRRKTDYHDCHRVLSNEFQASGENVPENLGAAPGDRRSDDHILRAQQSMDQTFHRYEETRSHNRGAPRGRRPEAQTTLPPGDLLEEPARNRSRGTHPSQGREHDAVRDLGRKNRPVAQRGDAQSVQYHAIRLGGYWILQEPRAAPVSAERG